MKTNTVPIPLATFVSLVMHPSNGVVSPLRGIDTSEVACENVYHGQYGARPCRRPHIQPPLREEFLVDLVPVLDDALHLLVGLLPSISGVADD